MSTVGFGEISPATNIGRAFIVIFIVGSFAMFTAIVPELITHIGKSSRYHKPYKRIYGKKHIVVCGHITYESVTNFIRNFLHEDSEITDINVVFIDNRKPDLELEAFFRRHLNDVNYIQGTVMDVSTCRNAKLRVADACLILANRNCDDPDEEDAANIMRATAVKNFDPDIRVIIQLLQTKNKTFLLHIPNWNWDRLDGGDDVLCIAELKLGILAQNCQAPGVSTLLSNLFYMRSCTPTSMETWQDAYRYGAGNELYLRKFSESFVGLTFAQTVEICYAELNILLIGLEIGSKYRTTRKLRINPGYNSVIGTHAQGFFISQSPEDADKVTTYVPQGFDDPALEEEAEEAENDLANHPRYALPRKSIPVDRLAIQDDLTLEYLEGIGSRLASYRQRRPSWEDDRMSEESTEDEEEESFDYTGMFHWSHSARRLQDFILNYEDVKRKNFIGHVVLCLLSEPKSPIFGLNNFVAPLRTSNFRMNELKDIIIMGDPEYVEKDWDSIANFPRVFVFKGNPAHRPDLRALNLERCAMCVILSAKQNIIVDQRLLDKDAILTCLNVKGMFGDDVEKRVKAIGVLANPEEFHRDASFAYEIPIATELEVDNNVAFLDQDDDDDPETPLFMTHPFASGTTFACSCLDSLMSATYQNSHMLRLIRALVTGGETAEFEQLLAEGLGIVRKHSKEEAIQARDRCRITQLPVASGLLAELKTKESDTYGSLFVKAIRYLGILCLGLYRLMDPEGKNLQYRKRYVITHPPFNFLLLETDKVFCLAPSTLQRGHRPSVINLGIDRPLVQLPIPTSTSTDEDDEEDSERPSRKPVVHFTEDEKDDTKL